MTDDDDNRHKKLLCRSFHCHIMLCSQHGGLLRVSAFYFVKSFFILLKWGKYMKNIFRFLIIFILFIITSLPIYPKENMVRFAAVGDVLLDRGIRKVMEERGRDYPLQAVSDCLNWYDLVFCNLECPLSELGKPMEKKYIFRGDPSTVEMLKKAGFNLFSLANNHTLDYGHEALMDTIDNLANAGLYPIGAGKDQKEALKPIIIRKNGLTLAFFAVLGYPMEGVLGSPDLPGPCQASIDELVSFIQNIRNQVDFIVVSFHWGFEYELQPHLRQIEYAHRVIEAGADLIIGHHPHVMQGIEKYRGKYILYSLGNFLFDQHDDGGKQSFLFGCTFHDGNLLLPHIIPIEIVHYQSCVATGEKADFIVSKIPLISDEGVMFFWKENGKYYLEEGSSYSSPMIIR